MTTINPTGSPSLEELAGVPSAAQLEKMANDLGYNYRYVSGVVNKFFRLSFLGVVNRYRVNYACDLLVNSEKGITEISMICGFESTRSFNRNFRSVMGTSPREYRSGKRDKTE